MLPKTEHSRMTSTFGCCKEVSSQYKVLSHGSCETDALGQTSLVVLVALPDLKETGEVCWKAGGALDTEGLDEDVQTRFQKRRQDGGGAQMAQ